jgi:transposase
MTKKTYTAEMKAKIAIDAIKGEVTLAELAKKYSVHPRQVQTWKSEMLSNAKGIFQRGKVDSKQDDHIEILERKVGQLLIENDFLKKNCFTLEQRNGNK